MTSPQHADEAESRLGTRLGNYALLEIIGRGGMGVVYEGQHIYIRKKVAVKVMYRHLFEDKHARQRFLQEAQAASRIEHPNVVAVTDFGESPDGAVFLVMTYLEGEPMEALLRRETVLPLFRVLGILSQTARALGAAHAQDVIHRDLKPDNILLQKRVGRREVVRTVDDDRGSIDYVEPEGEFDFATVLDFGAATIRDAVGAQQTTDGTVIATPYYMAPETAHHGAADARSDIYAMGVIFYRALTGTLPFEGRNAREIMTRHVYDPIRPPRLRHAKAEITDDAERVIMKALAKDPNARHQTMEELYADLQRCYGRVRFRRVKNAPHDQVLADAGATPHPIRLTRSKADSAPPPPRYRTPVSTTPPPLAGRGGTAGGQPVTTPVSPRTTSDQPAAGQPLRLTKRKMSAVPESQDRPPKPQDRPQDQPQDRPQDRPQARPQDRQRDEKRGDSYERRPTLPFGQAALDQERREAERRAAQAELEPNRHKTNPWTPSVPARKKRD